MKSSEFAAKFKSRYLWGNLIAMALVVVVVIVGVWFGLSIYTHHGESVSIPNLRGKSFGDASQILSNLGLGIEVSDTGYVKSLPPDCVLGQSPDAGEDVKTGRVIYVTINSTHSPTITLPDIIDNSSLREAMAKLTAMGFKVGEPQFVSGEKDWVYGVLVNGRHVETGDRISVEDRLVIQVGNGMRDDADSVFDVSPQVYDDGGDVDEFKEVTGPDNTGSDNGSESGQANHHAE